MKARRQRKLTTADLADVPAAIVAAALRITPRRLRQMVLERILPTPKNRGHFNLIEYVHAFIDQRLGRGDEVLATARRQREQQELRISKAKADALEGRTVSLDDHERVGAAAMRILARELDGLPGRLAGELGIRSPATIDRMAAEIRRVRESGARRMRELADELCKPR